MQGWTTVFAWVCTCALNPAIMSNIIISLASWNKLDYVIESMACYPAYVDYNNFSLHCQLLASELHKCVGDCWRGSTLFFSLIASSLKGTADGEYLNRMRRRAY